MYQRFHKLFFKHSYTIAQPLSGTSSSLTTKLSKSTLESRLQVVFRSRLKVGLQRSISPVVHVLYVSLYTAVGTVKWRSQKRGK